jgi:hypothetical protein
LGRSWKPRREDEDNNKMDLRQINGSVWTEFIWLRTEAIGGLSLMSE